MTTTEKLLANEEVYEIPFTSAETGVWEGLQYSLTYDPNQVEVLELIPGQVLPIQPEHWAIPAPGTLNLSWSDPEPAVILAGKPLFSLRVRARAPLKISEICSQKGDKSSINPEVYPEGGIARPLKVKVEARATMPGSEAITPIPNPTSGASFWPVELEEASSVMLELLDGNGRLVWSTEQFIPAGIHRMEMPAAALQQSGVYHWRIQMNRQVITGRLIRI